jgi:hypothetical protein
MSLEGYGFAQAIPLPQMIWTPQHRQHGQRGNGSMTGGATQAAGEDTDGWFSGDPYRLVRGTGSERFMEAISAVRTRQLDIVGRARADMASLGIDLDGILADFAHACLIPGVEAEVVEASDMSGLYGCLVAAPAIRFSSAAMGTRQVALGIDRHCVDIRFVVIDVTISDSGDMSVTPPETVQNLDAFFDRLAFIAGDFQAQTMSANVRQLESLDGTEFESKWAWSARLAVASALRKGADLIQVGFRR